MREHLLTKTAELCTSRRAKSGGPPIRWCPDRDCVPDSMSYWGIVRILDQLGPVAS